MWSFKCNGIVWEHHTEQATFEHLEWHLQEGCLREVEGEHEVRDDELECSVPNCTFYYEPWWELLPPNSPSSERR